MRYVRRLTISTLVGLAAWANPSLAYLKRGVGSGAPPPIVSVVPGAFAPGTCIGCVDSAGDSENWFYGVSWQPQHQPPRTGSSASKYYNSDVMFQWMGAQLQTITSPTLECGVGASPSLADNPANPAGVGHDNRDRGIDHVNVAADGGAVFNIPSPQSDPTPYSIVSITGNGTTATATLAVPFAFDAPLAGVPGEGYGYHITIAGAGAFNGSYQLTASVPADLTHANATVSFASAVTGTFAGGAMTVAEPMYWCFPIDPAQYNDGLHEIRADVEPKIGWPRLMQGVHYIPRSAIDTVNGTGIFTSPAHGFSADRVTIISETGASPCLHPTGTTGSAQQYYIATQNNPGMSPLIQPSEPLRGYQFALFDASSNTVVNMNSCSDDNIVIDDFHGFGNTSGFSNRNWMPYGDVAVNLLLPGLRNNHSFWFFTNSHGHAYNPTVNVDSSLGNDVANCGASTGAAACKSIDGALAFSPALNPIASGNNYGQNNCLFNAANNSSIWTTPVGTGGACNLIVGQVVWSAEDRVSGAAFKFGMHDSMPYYVEGIAGQATGTTVAAGGSFIMSSIPIASPVGAPTCNGATPPIASNPYVICGSGTGTNGSFVGPNFQGPHVGGDGVTILLAGTPASPRYYNYGAQPDGSAAGNFNQWFTIQGQTQMGAIINKSGRAQILVDSTNTYHTVTSGSVSGTAETVNFASGTAIGVGTSVYVRDLQCSGGCGSPNGGPFTVTASTATSVTFTNPSAASGTMDGIFTLAQGPAYSWVHLQNLSICGIDPAINLSAICSPTETKPYSNINLLAAPSGQLPKGGIWEDNVYKVGIGAWTAVTCGGVVPCGATTVFGNGVWVNNTQYWQTSELTNNGVLGGIGASAIENVLHSQNLGQFANTGLLRNVTDDGEVQDSPMQLACTAYFAAGNPGSVCTSGGNLNGAQTIVPVTAINPAMITSTKDFNTAATALGGGPTYGFRFGWNPTGAIWGVTNPQTTLTMSCTAGSGCTSTCSSVSSCVQACYDPTGAAPNCPAGQAAFIGKESAGVPLIQLQQGGSSTTNITASSSSPSSILMVTTSWHGDSWFIKENGGGTGNASSTNLMAIDFNIPNRPCNTATTGFSCNISQGIITQAGLIADWAILDSPLGQIANSGIAKPDIDPGEFVENLLVANTIFGSTFVSQMNSELPGRTPSGFFSSPLFPPGGGPFGSGAVDGFVWSNDVCTPQNHLSQSAPMYYGYWTQSIVGNGTNATVVIDPGVTIPAGTLFSTLDQDPNNVGNTIFAPGGYTAFNTGSGTVVGSVAGHVSWANATNLPLINNGQNPSASTTSTGVIIPTPGNGTSSDASSYINSPPVDACAN